MERILQYGFRRSQCGRWFEDSAGVRVWDGFVLRMRRSVGIASSC